MGACKLARVANFFSVSLPILLKRVVQHLLLELSVSNK